MGAARRPSFFRSLRVSKLSTTSVLGPVPAASINPTAVLCLAGRPRSHHLLGAVGAWLSHAITSGDSFGAGCLTTSQDQHSEQEPRPGATRLEVGPRESRAGSRVPRYTSSSPAVQATCQGGAVHAPGALRSRESPTHAPVEAPCSALAVDTAEERLCPCTSGSTMLRAGDKQLRAAPRPYQPQGAQSSVSGLTATPPLGRAVRGG